jgi:hypothetical protein
MVAILMPDSGKNVVKRILMIVAVQRCGLIDRPCAMFKLVASTITCTGAVCPLRSFLGKTRIERHTTIGKETRLCRTYASVDAGRQPQSPPAGDHDSAYTDWHTEPLSMNLTSWN